MQGRRLPGALAARQAVLSLAAAAYESAFFLLREQRFVLIPCIEKVVFILYFN